MTLRCDLILAPRSSDPPGPPGVLSPGALPPEALPGGAPEVVCCELAEPSPVCRKLPGLTRSLGPYLGLDQLHRRLCQQLVERVATTNRPEEEEQDGERPAGGELLARVGHILRGDERDWLGIIWTLVRLIALVPYRLLHMGLAFLATLLRRNRPAGADAGSADGNPPRPRAAWLRPLLAGVLRWLRPVPGVVFVATLATMVFMVCPLGWVAVVAELVLSAAVLLALWRLHGFWKLCAVLSLGLLLIPLVLGEGSPSRAGDLLAEVNAGLRELPWQMIGQWMLLTAPTVLAGVGVVLSLKGKGGSLRRLAGKLARGEGGSTRATSLSCAGRVVRCLVAFRAWLRPWLLILGVRERKKSR